MCIIICHLTLFGTISPVITSLIDIVLNVYLLLRTELELERRGGWVARENLLSVMKVIY